MCQKRKSTSRKAKTKCAEKYCKRPRSKRGRLCYKHEHQRRKYNNPYLYWYGVNRRNANRRAKKAGNGKFWYVTFEYFCEFCYETGYLILKGRGAEDMTLDCIKNELGYVDGNLQLLKNYENASKGTKKVTWNYLTNTWDVVTQTPVPIETDLPF